VTHKELIELAAKAIEHELNAVGHPCISAVNDNGEGVTIEPLGQITEDGKAVKLQMDVVFGKQGVKVFAKWSVECSENLKGLGNNILFRQGWVTATTKTGKTIV